jgi:predicted AAA+ superfamily ATPase
VRLALAESPVVALLGARQVGKTTLARQVARALPATHHFDLETPADRAALAQPVSTLRDLHGLVVVDEVQRVGALFEVLRPLVDRVPLPAQFLLLGSASPHLVRGVSESLAGRCRFVRVGGFALGEVGSDALGRLWARGGFPRSFLAPSDGASRRWREAFLTTFLERDIPQLGIRVPAETLRRFWTMLAHWHGRIWNAAALAQALGTGEKTARHYLDILHGTYVARILAPWHENVAKRQVKSPKVYLRDSGLLHSLLSIGDLEALRRHPTHGASWEGFALEQVLALTGDANAYFWATPSGAELDLFLLHEGERLGFEFKCEDAPTMTKSLHIALDDLHLARAWVIYPGARRYRLHERVEAIPLAALPAALSER